MQILRHTPSCGISFATQLHPQTTPANTRPRLTPTWQFVFVGPLKFSGWPFNSCSVKLWAAFCTAGRTATSNSVTGRTELFKAQWSPYVQPVVTIRTGQWPPYVQPSGHYMRSQWSLYVQRGGHHVYRPVATIRTAQWSLYVQHSAVVTICTAQWSLYVQPSSHHMHSPVVTICKLVGFCNRDGVCLLRGTGWIFIYNSG